MWSYSLLNVILIRIRGTLPFFSEEKELTFQYCLSGDYIMEGDPVFNQVSNEIKNLIKSMLEVDPKDRITLTEALNHSWFKTKVSNEKVLSQKKIDFNDLV